MGQGLPQQAVIAETVPPWTMTAGINRLRH
jgi:hypothetical protein